MTNLGSSRSTKEPARISGNVVIAKVSGETISISGIVIVISSAIIHADVSGESVYAYISGGTVITVPDYITFEAAATGTGAVGLALSVTSTYIVDYATYHATSGTTTSSELYIELRHGAGTGYYTKLVSVDMINKVSNVYWTPDAELWLTSGDSIAMIFSNPNICTYGAAIRVKRP